MSEGFLCSFTNPNSWSNIFATIIDKLGPKFYEWSGGVNFREYEVMTIFHQDKVQKVRVRLHCIEVFEPAVAGDWLTFFRIKKAVVFAVTKHNGVQPEEVTDDTELVFADSKARVAFFGSFFEELLFCAVVFKDKPTVREIVDRFMKISSVARGFEE